MLFGVIVQQVASDVFHHQIRQPIIGNPAVKQTGDIRVIQTGQYLPFLSKAPNTFSAEEVYRDVLGDPNPNIAYLKQMSGKMHILTGDLDKAIKDLQTSVDIFSATRRPDNPLLLQSKAALGLALVKRGRLDVAETQLRDAKTAAGTLPPENELRIEIDSAFGECLTAQKKFAEAEFLLLSVRSALQNQARLAKQSFENEKRLSHLYKKWNRPPDKPR